MAYNSDLYNEGSVTEKEANAELGKRAKQAMLAQQAAEIAASRARDIGQMEGLAAVNNLRNNPQYGVDPRDMYILDQVNYDQQFGRTSGEPAPIESVPEAVGVDMPAPQERAPVDQRVDQVDYPESDAGLAAALNKQRYNLRTGQ